MLGNREKMVVISSTTNEWPQNQIDEKSLMASSNTLMEKPGQDQPPQQPLKCPRCDSSNTKFCYYNNYSLSQPRHFCKACKRYWTRGGTLRNVPVGGGCRKNKRVKRPSSSIDGASSTPSAANTNPPTQAQIDISSTSNHINSLFYGLPTNRSGMNLPISRFNSGVSSVDTVSGYDLQPQLNALGLGFSSRLMSNDTSDSSNNYRNGFNPTKQIQDVVTSTSLLSSTYSTFGSSTSVTTTSPTMASLLLRHQKNINGGVKSSQAHSHFNSITPLEDLNMTANGGARISMKEVKAEEGQNRMDWNVACQNQMEPIGLSDPSLYWNATSVGAWYDPSNNVGSSVTSLI